MRLGLLLGGVVVVTMSCTPGGQPPAQVSPHASPTPFAGSPVTPAAGLNGIVGWDGVDQSVMLAAPVENTNLNRTGIGAWLLTDHGWKSMPSPSPLADEYGFGTLTLNYDSDRHLELLTSSPGRDYGGGPTTVSEWDGRSWRDVKSSNGPSQGFRFGAYSPDLHALVGIGPAPPQNVTWLYDANGWRQVPATLITPESFPVAFAYDPAHHVILALDATGRTWKFEGTTWMKQDLNPPTPLGGGSVTFDPQHGSWIFYGGAQQQQQPAQTWIGNGASWTQLSPPASPPSRSMLSGTHLAWDPVRRNAVLFGGFFGFCCDVVYKDTWAYDGRTWKKLLDAPPLATPGQIPAASPCIASTSSYGLLMVSGALQIIDTCGKVAASTPLAPSSVSTCSGGGPPAMQAPPVSASDQKIYFRDGDTKIRNVNVDGTTGDVTTVPGGPTTLSMFSVSPDDQRIAVVVEDLSAPGTIAIQLYVEDLAGRGHHVDIYSTTVAKSGGTTLWPVGWHSGLLVLGVVPACGAAFSTVSPSEWHLVDPATGNRAATVTGDGSCVLGKWPSSVADTCATLYNHTQSYNWNNVLTWDVAVGFAEKSAQSGLSPSGQRLFVSGTGSGACVIGRPSTGTCVITGAGTAADPRRQTQSDNHFGCLWIDSDHILAPDAVIQMPSPDFPKSQYVPAIPLPAAGVCAGRFPAGLG